VKKCLTLLYILLFSFSVQLQAQIYEAAELTYSRVSGNTYDFTVRAYVRDSTKVQQIYFNFGGGIIAVSPTSSKADTFYFTASQTLDGPGSYYVTATLPNRVAGIQNIPGSDTTAIGLMALLVINPSLGPGFFPCPVYHNPPIATGGLTTYSYNSDATVSISDSLSYKILPCRNVSGYTYPSSSGTFRIDSLTGTVVWNAPVSTGLFNFCIEIDEFFDGYIVGSSMREVEVKISNLSSVENFLMTNSLEIVPNPATNLVTVKSSGNKPYTIQLMTMSGQLAYSPVNSWGQEFSFDVSTLPKGIYIIQLINIQNNTAGRQKLVIQ